MVCVSGTTEVEGIIERLPVMMEENDKLDMMIEKNVELQLSQVNWERLNAAISNRLDNVQRKTTFSIQLPLLVKIGATIAAAAIVLITFSLNIEKLTEVKLDNGRTAEVQFLKSKGSASVQIQANSAGSEVMVRIEPDRTLAKCHIEIKDSSNGFRENTTRAAWIIISRPQRVYADNGAHRDMMDIMYLF
jgi:hypothetical protein